MRLNERRTAAMSPARCARNSARVHLGELDGGHRADRAARELVGDVPPAGAAEDAAQRRGRACAQPADPRARRQRLFLDVRDLRNRVRDVEHDVDGEPASGRRRRILQHDRHGGGARGSDKERGHVGRRRQGSGRHDHHRRRADVARLAHRRRRRRRVGGRSTDDERHPAARDAGDDLDEARALVLRQRLVFARDTWKDDAVGAGVDRVTRDRREARLVGRKIRMERRGEHGKHAGEHVRHGGHCAIAAARASRGRTFVHVRRRVE